MAKAQFDNNKFKPLYAGVGVADLAIEAVREYAAELQKMLTDVRVEVTNLDLPSEAKTFPTKAQKYVDENLSTVAGAYGDLVVRGEGLVRRIRSQESTKATVKSARTTSAKAKTTTTQSTKAAKSTAKTTKKSVAKKSAPAKRSAKATRTAATKTATSAAKATADAAAKVGD